MKTSVDDIKATAKLLLSSNDRKNYNSIVKLVGQYSHLQLAEEVQFAEQEPTARCLTVSLYQVFRKLFFRGQLNPSKATTDKEKLFFQWCRKAYGSFKSKLLHCISSLPFESSLALDCLDVYMKLIEQEAIFFASQDGAPFFPNKTLKALIRALLESNIPGSIDATDGQSKSAVIQEFSEKYYQKFVDVQYYFQAELVQLTADGDLDQLDNTQLMAKWLCIMNHDNHYCNENADLEVFVAQPPQAIEMRGSTNLILKRTGYNF